MVQQYRQNGTVLTNSKNLDFASGSRKKYFHGEIKIVASFNCLSKNLCLITSYIPERAPVPTT